MTRLENGPIEPMGELLGARGGRLGPHIPELRPAELAVVVFPLFAPRMIGLTNEGRALKIALLTP